MAQRRENMLLYPQKNPSHEEKKYQEMLQEFLNAHPKENQLQPKPLTEPLIGWRVWGFREGKLWSTFIATVSWPYRKALQADDPNWHMDKSNPNGIHAVKHRREALNMAGGSNRIMGTVSLWGRVDQYTEGFRAEFAYPKELFVNPSFDPLQIMELEENYGVPVEFAHDLPDYGAFQKQMQAAQQAQLAAQAQMLQNQVIVNVRTNAQAWGQYYPMQTAAIQVSGGGPIGVWGTGISGTVTGL